MDINIKASTIIMDLIWHYTKSSIGLSENQHEQLRKLWGMLTPYGKEHFQLWAEDNDMTLPNYCEVN